MLPARFVRRIRRCSVRADLAGALLGLYAAVGCAARSAPVPVVMTDVEAAPSQGAAPEAEAAMKARPLSPEERALVEPLERDMARLTSFGVPNLASPLTLATLTDDLALQLEALGYEVRRGGFLAEEAALMNLEVVVPGRERGHQNIVLGAHFDVKAEASARHDSASSVALLLSVARWLVQRRPLRTLRLVWFSNDGQGERAAEHTGSYEYAKGARIEGREISLVIYLDSLGQSSRSRRLRVISHASAQVLQPGVLRALEQSAFFRPTTTIFDELDEGPPAGHLSFVHFGYAALLLTDEAASKPGVNPEVLARIAAVLPRVLEQLAGPFQDVAPRAAAAP